MSRLSTKPLENSVPPSDPSRLAGPAKASAERDRGDNLPSKL